MFLDVTLYKPGVVDTAKEVIAKWAAEHAGYYGTPHGMSGSPYGGYGFCRLAPDGGSWLTSGHNYHALQILPDEHDRECVRLIYSGRRHGMRHEFIVLLRNFWESRIGYHERVLHAYVTHEPEWLPWETADDHHALEEA